jgi:arabinan endo-1,5-alpha-L-arabinosidase
MKEIIRLTVAFGLLAMLLPQGRARGQTSAPASQPAKEDLQKILTGFGNRNVGVHDPSPIVKCKDQYWLFTTGANTPSFHSSDLMTWTPGPKANVNPPQWVRQAVPLNRGNDFWAPDVIKVGDRYMLFFAVSSFGKNTSAIGVATNPTLDPNDPGYRWTDGGIAVQSRENDDFNALDPSAMFDRDGKLWLAFGSFWGGIRLIELDPATGKRIAPDSPMYSLAHWDSIEAPYLYHHGQYYYLFASMGMCCRGVNSTYFTVVGRSKDVRGPYVDMEGQHMLLGGGSTFVESDGPLIGPGQGGILEEGGKYWFSCHFYDATAQGASKLSIRPLTWSEDGWPILGKMDGSR